MSAAFEAMYVGWCGVCEERIHPGDAIRFDEDRDIIHDACVSASPERVRPVCPICWLTSCDCEVTA